MRAVMMLSCLSLAACAGGLTSKSEVSRIDPGMTRDEVRAILGEPGERSFSENREAWQYCRIGFWSDAAPIVWFKDGVVSALTSDRGGGASSCVYGFSEIDWGQVPPDLRIEVN
jgi:hypothetical protein